MQQISRYQFSDVKNSLHDYHFLVMTHSPTYIRYAFIMIFWAVVVQNDICRKVDHGILLYYSLLILFTYHSVAPWCIVIIL